MSPTQQLTLQLFHQLHLGEVLPHLFQLLFHLQMEEEVLQLEGIILQLPHLLFHLQLREELPHQLLLLQFHPQLLNQVQTTRPCTRHWRPRTRN